MRASRARERRSRPSHSGRSAPFSAGRAGSALDLAGLEARGADVETLRGHARVAHQRLDALDVGVPAALGAAVRERDAVTEARSLAADVAVGSHGVLLKFDGDKT